MFFTLFYNKRPLVQYQNIIIGRFCQAKMSTNFVELSNCDMMYGGAG